MPPVHPTLHTISNFFFKQKKCLNKAYENGTCEVKLAMLECGHIDGGWDCLKQIPEVEDCYLHQEEINADSTEVLDY